MSSFYKHKLKCTCCGLHFVVCSDHSDWPDHGTTKEERTGEATGLVHCPECGAAAPPTISTTIVGTPGDIGSGPRPSPVHGFMHWIEEVDGFIFQEVPGKARPAGLPGAAIPKPPSEVMERLNKEREKRRKRSS